MKGDFMPDQVVSDEEKTPIGNRSGVPAKTEDGSVGCRMQGKGWFKGGLVMVACCAGPLLLGAAIALFGISLGALVDNFLSIALLVACPVGMYLMMRMMIKNKQ
jgi:hypothetical protein